MHYAHGVSASSDNEYPELAALLRQFGARFAFLHGSRVAGTAREDSDLDVAAWFGDNLDDEEVLSQMPAGVDLLILNGAPLWIAGRVAMTGVRLFDDDPPGRVGWQAETRKRYVDEQFRRDQIRRDFVKAHG